MDASRLPELRADVTADLELTGVTATVRISVPTETELGGIVYTPGDGETYPVNVQELAEPEESTGAGGETTSLVELVAFLPWNAEINEKDVLRIEGIDYTVEGTNSAVNARLSLEAKLLRTT